MSVNLKRLNVFLTSRSDAVSLEWYSQRPAYRGLRSCSAINISFIYILAQFTDSSHKFIQYDDYQPLKARTAHVHLKYSHVSKTRSIMLLFLFPFHSTVWLLNQKSLRGKFPFFHFTGTSGKWKPANGADLPFHPALTYFGIIVLRVH